jgi:hypothetical protein
MLMLMMICSSFSDSNTRGVTIGKINGKKERISLQTGPEGGFWPSRGGGGHTRGHAGRRPSSACQRERRGDGVVGAGPRASEGEKNDVRGSRGGEVGQEKNRPPEFDGGSPPVTRFRAVGEVVKHGWG